MNHGEDAIERAIWGQSTDGHGQDTVIRLCHTSGGVIKWVNGTDP